MAPGRAERGAGVSVYTPAYPPTYTEAMPTGIPGGQITLYLDFYNEENGVLTDPSSVELDITFGEAVGFALDVAGPFTYYGSGTAGVGYIYRIARGQYDIHLADPGRQRRLACSWPTGRACSVGHAARRLELRRPGDVRAAVGAGPSW